MEMVEVQSSHLASVGYDNQTQTLRIAFHDGSVYDYAGVSDITYQMFRDAPSKGVFFHRVIRPRFQATKVDSSA